MSLTSLQPLDPQPELILFDLDDTLASTSMARKARLRRVFARALERLDTTDRPDPDLLVADSLSVSFDNSDHYRELLARYGVHHPEAAAEAAEWMLNNRYHGLELLPGAIDTLNLIRASAPDRRIGMITNGPEEIQAPKLELLELRPYFDFVIISGAFGAHKPDPSIFAEALRLGETTADSAIYIGDSQENDIAGALDSGITPIWMNNVGREWIGDDPLPEIVITDLVELHPLLQIEP